MDKTAKLHARLGVSRVQQLLKFNRLECLVYGIHHDISIDHKYIELFFITTSAFGLPIREKVNTMLYSMSLLWKLVTDQVHELSFAVVACLHSIKGLPP